MRYAMKIIFLTFKELKNLIVFFDVKKPVAAQSGKKFPPAMVVNILAACRRQKLISCGEKRGNPGETYQHGLLIRLPPENTSDKL